MNMPQALPAIPLKEFDLEMASTRRVIERVPSEKAQWKPHEKSYALGHLALLVSSMPAWINRTLHQDVIDLAGGPGLSYETTETLLNGFDQYVSAARQALMTVTGAALEASFSVRNEDGVMFTSLRGEGVREHLNHLIHHRGQLTVYLRLLNIPLPQIYGPTADEK